MATPEKDYSRTPLYKKLGIKDGAKVAVVLLFATRLKDLRARYGPLAEAVYPNGRLWIAHPKKSSSVPTDLNFDNVQTHRLEAGLVDNKSCAIDADYSGVQFVYRLADR